MLRTYPRIRSISILLLVPLFENLRILKIKSLFTLYLAFSDSRILALMVSFNHARRLDNQNFNIQYTRRSLHRMLPKLLEHQAVIGSAAIQTARDGMLKTFSLVLYDVTTL